MVFSPSLRAQHLCFLTMASKVRKIRLWCRLRLRRAGAGRQQPAHVQRLHVGLSRHRADAQGRGRGAQGAAGGVDERRATARGASISCTRRFCAAFRSTTRAWSSRWRRRRASWLHLTAAETRIRSTRCWRCRAICTARCCGLKTYSHFVAFPILCHCEAERFSG